MHRSGAALLAFVIMAASTALATPPERGEPPTQKRPPAAVTEPAVELALKNGQLSYSYDLSGIFDQKMWQVLEENGYSEVTVEVKLRDAQDAVRLTRFHQLKIELLSSGRVRVMTSPRRGKIYASRTALREALKRVAGEPLEAERFHGSSGHLEVVVLVNPVKVYAFPANDRPVADQRVVPRTVYDRRLELRSRSLR